MVSMNNGVGYLELIIGPMYSGKTSKLLAIKKKYDICNIPCCVINYIGDNRYHDTMLSTHDNVMIPCINAELLKDVLTERIIKKYTVFLINEGQFFYDLYENVFSLVEDYSKKVYICGLDGDYKRQKFGQILDLIPICDNIKKEHAICSICKNGNKALFSQRITKNIEQKLIGSKNYQTVCRKCFKKKDLN